MNLGRRARGLIGLGLALILLLILWPLVGVAMLLLLFLAGGLRYVARARRRPRR